MALSSQRLSELLGVDATHAVALVVGLKDFFGIDGQHTDINTDDDDKTVRINSRSYTQTSGSSIGMQSKPSQTVTTTGDVIGAEFSPRPQDGVGLASLIGVRADPLIKGTTGDITGSVRGFETNLDLADGESHTRTITGDVVAFRAFLQAPSSGITYTGDVSVFQVAAPNTRQWDYLLDVEAGNGTIAVETGGTYSTADGYLVIKVGASDMRIPFFAGAD